MCTPTFTSPFHINTIQLLRLIEVLFITSTFKILFQQKKELGPLKDDICLPFIKRFSQGASESWRIRQRIKRELIKRLMDRKTAGKKENKCNPSLCFKASNMLTL